MKTLNKRFTFLAVVLALVLGVVPHASAQTTTTQTTTAAAITSTSQNVIVVTSATGFTASTNSVPTFIYVATLAGDPGELMRVDAVSSTNITVRRGQAGTPTLFPSGAVVYFGRGGARWDPVTGHASGVLLDSGPVDGRTCTAASNTNLPVVDIRTGRVSDCVGSVWRTISITTVIATHHAQLAAALVDQTFFQATRAYRVMGCSFIGAVAEATAGTLRVQVTKDTGTDAPGAGTDLLTNTSNAGFDVKATANTVQVGTLTATAASLLLATGNRLSVDYTAAATEGVGITITCNLLPI